MARDRDALAERRIAAWLIEGGFSIDMTLPTDEIAAIRTVAGMQLETCALHQAFEWLDSEMIHRHATAEIHFDFNRYETRLEGCADSEFEKLSGQIAEKMTKMTWEIHRTGPAGLGLGPYRHGTAG